MQQITTFNCPNLTFNFYNLPFISFLHIFFSSFCHLNDDENENEKEEEENFKMTITTTTTTER